MIKEEFSGMYTIVVSFSMHFRIIHSICRPPQKTGVNEGDVTGFNPPKNEFTVIFHVLIPKYAWGWKDSESYVTLKFGHKKLGYWERVGNFKCKR